MPRRTILAVALGSGLLSLAVARPDEPSLPVDVTTPPRVDLPPQSFIQTVPGTDSKFDLVYVPGGEFRMGSPDAEEGRTPDEGPQHRVKVNPFWLGRCEVTWDEYYAFWKDEKLFKIDEVPQALQGKWRPDAITRPTNTYVDELYDHGREGHPAICMTHHAAMMYCHWLRWKTGRGFRLPTEAEWEYACRAGTDGPYGIPPGEKLGDYAWFKGNSGDDDHPDGTTHKVGTKRPNSFGLYDLHGNVAEWCLDHYSPDFYKRSPAAALSICPVNVPTDSKWSHVARGGSWADKPDRLRSAARRGSDKTWMRHDPQLPQSIWWLTRMDVIGFRVCLPAEEYPALVGVKPMVVKKAD